MTKEEIQASALQVVLPLRRSGVVISMGVGKTYLALQHLDALMKNGNNMIFSALVVAPKRSVFQTWIDEMSKFGFEHLIPFISFTTYLSLNKKDPKQFDIIYLDESHTIKESHEEWLSNYKGMILGLTGTPTKKGKRAQIAEKYFPTKFTYIIDQAIKDGLLNNYKIYVNKLELDPVRNITKTSKSGKVWRTSELDEYHYWCSQLDKPDLTPAQIQISRIMRMKCLQSFKSKTNTARLLSNVIAKSGEKCLVFANTANQANEICSYRYHSKWHNSKQDLEDFKKGNIKTLSAVLQLNEGINIPNLKNIIIMHSYGNERKFAQRLGRAMRLNPDQESNIYVLCYENTVDDDWLRSALIDFNPEKIKYM